MKPTNLSVCGTYRTHFAAIQARQPRRRIKPLGEKSTHVWQEDNQREPYVVMVSTKFLMLSILSSALVAYAAGRAARFILMEGTMKAILFPHGHSGTTEEPYYFLDYARKKLVALPSPKIRSEKEMPHTTYSSKTFDTSAAESSQSVMIEKKQLGNGEKKKTKAIFQSGQQWMQCPTSAPSNHNRSEETAEHCEVSASSIKVYHEWGSQDDAAEIHLPAGQHLIVDMKDVDRYFLNDKHRLAQAMVDLIWAAESTLISYHCHELHPSGVTCVGVLLESHISFHTWPEQGVITLDLFTCGSGLLVPVMSMIERLFAVPYTSGRPTEQVDRPTIVWAHKLRGFRSDDDKATIALRHDLGRDILGVMDFDMKKEVASIKSKFQQIDIYDVIDPRFGSIVSYHRSLSNDGSYEAVHPEYYQPNRQLFLDGTQQSTLHGNEAYHEGLVHPGMFAHNNPKRVAIIGGGEGATLREVLKHNTVEDVIMVEIDEGVVKAARKYLPSWNDCSDIVGSTRNCFDDLRTEMLNQDALAWFMHRFGDVSDDSCNREKFDVIIMDALDPEERNPFAQALYSNDAFTSVLYNALGEDGIIIMQLGEAPHLRSNADEDGKFKNRSDIVKGLQRAGFESMHAYDEAHCGFRFAWTYLVLCKDYSCRKNWYASDAEFDVAIRNRILRTYSGTPPLKHFDGALMKSYQVPPKAFEVVFCRQRILPEECSYLQGYNKSVANVPITAFKVRRSVGSIFKGGRGVFAKVGVPAGSMIAQEQQIHSIHFPPSVTRLMSSFYNREPEVAKGLLVLQKYIEDYSFENMLLGESSYDAHASILCFVNHGCNGTHNINSDPAFHITEVTADPDHMPATHYPKGFFQDVFNPVVARHLPHLIGGYDVALRDIKRGEEILDNYLTLVSSEENWEDLVDELADECEKRA